MKRNVKRVLVDKDNPSIFRDESKCVNCGMCKLVCNRDIGVDGYYDKSKHAVCVHCGQCVVDCPFGALQVVSQKQIVKNAIADKTKIVVFNIAPAVRVALGECFGLSSGENVEQKIVSAAKMIGANYVFDVAFGADLTIMEEATELVERIKQNKLPMFTSCCPAWVRYLEIFMPEKTSNLSSARSPIAMQGAVVKTYFAKQKAINPKNIFSVAVAPCSAKKAEILREEYCASGKFWKDAQMRDIDAVITTNEFFELCKEFGVDVANAKDQNFDSLLGSGAGVIFGNTGGVMEAALRTAYYFLNGAEAPKSFLNLKSVRGNESVREAEIDLKVAKIKVAVIFGTAKAREYLIANENNLPHFIEVMACPNGCVGGAGQPKTQLGDAGEETRNGRVLGLYAADKKRKIRTCHKNPEIQKLYSDFLVEPNSEIAKQLLHTKYVNRSVVLSRKAKMK